MTRNIWLALSITALALLLSIFRYTQSSLAATGWTNKIDPWVMNSLAGGKDTEFLLYLSEQADLSGADELPTKLEKGEYVVSRLNEVAERTQKPVLAALARQGLEYRSFRVANVIWVRGPLAAAQSMALRSDVAYLYANPKASLQLPDETQADVRPAASTGVEWNLLKVNADKAWAAGDTGVGAVIGGQDTGYDWDHPALKDKYRGWNGAAVDHDDNWHDAIHTNTHGDNICGYDSPAPCDDDQSHGGHGTHTMGTMVGDDGAGHQIGMAPGAKWIGCRNMDNGWGSPDSYTECYDWFIAPYPVGGNTSQGDPSKAPDVINNSWSCPEREGCAATDPNVLLTVVNNVRHAGILTVHSAGNSGSSCGTVSTPAAIYASSFSVGATDSSDSIASFSSRGPVTIDGSNRQKPEISAPGVNILSSLRGGGYGALSGTSMAAPHVAGLAALLVSADPGLRGHPDALQAIIESSAAPRTTAEVCGGVPGSQIPNNTYGWGRIDAWAALQKRLLAINGQVTPHMVRPGGSLTYTFTITSIFTNTNVVITDVLPTNALFMTATLPYTHSGGVLSWGYPNLGSNITRDITVVVSVPLTTTGSLLSQYTASSDQAPENSLSPLRTYLHLIDIIFPFVSGGL